MLTLFISSLCTSSIFQHVYLAALHFTCKTRIINCPSFKEKKNPLVVDRVNSAQNFFNPVPILATIFLPHPLPLQTSLQKLSTTVDNSNSSFPECSFSQLLSLSASYLGYIHYIWNSSVSLLCWNMGLLILIPVSLGSFLWIFQSFQLWELYHWHTNVPASSQSWTPLLKAWWTIEDWAPSLHGLHKPFIYIPVSLEITRLYIAGNPIRDDLQVNDC